MPTYATLLAMTAQDQLDPNSKHKLTVQEYLLLDREGAFGDRRTELFDGEVYYMSPKHRPHARIWGSVFVALHTALERLDNGLSVLGDISVHLSEFDVPEPDIAITDEPEGEGILPLSAFKLAVEVADTTLAKDLGLKAKLYARARVPEYWVVDVRGKRVLIHTCPADEGKAAHFVDRYEVPFGEPIHAATIEGLHIETDGWG